VWFPELRAKIGSRLDPSLQSCPEAIAASVQDYSFIDRTLCNAYYVCMQFEYDPQKAKSNRQKHGISFAEAEMVFFDPLTIHELDPDSTTEERFIALGMGNTGSILVVVYTLRGEIIRLISARRATKQETKIYETGI
jgi:uncharacterized DUF497 family protein